MKEFAISETARIRLKAMVNPIFLAVALKQLEFSIDPFPVVEFMFADLFTARQHSVTVGFNNINCSILQMLTDHELLLKISCHLRSLATVGVNKNH